MHRVAASRAANTSGRFHHVTLPDGLEFEPDRIPLHRSAQVRPAVMLALDNPDTRCTLRDHLSENGFHVFATGESRVALEWLHRRRVDAVLTDMLLPGTRTALPHLLCRAKLPSRPLIIGIAQAGFPCDGVQQAFSYDLVVRSGTPAAVLTRTLLQLLPPRHA